MLRETTIPAKRNVDHRRIIKAQVRKCSAFRRPPDRLVFGQNLLFVQPVRNAEFFIVRSRVGHLLGGTVEAGPVVEVVCVRDHQCVALWRPVDKVKLRLLVWTNVQVIIWLNWYRDSELKREKWL